MVDVLCAVHFQSLPNLSTTELFVGLPLSRHQFQDVYWQLLNGFEPLPSNINGREDALLLLVALLCDIIYIQHNELTDRMRSTPGVNGPDFFPSRGPPVNPYAPLSRTRERERQQKSLLNALDRWHQHFAAVVDKNVLALFFFCQLVLSCPDLMLLPRLAKYPISAISGMPLENRASVSGARQVSVSEDAVKYAWKAVDHVDVSQKSFETQLPIWLPLTLFLSALVVWQSLRTDTPLGRQYGSLKVLRTFIHELNQLPWDCCRVMASVLGQLSMGDVA